MRTTLARLATGSILVLALVACPATTTGTVQSVTIAGGDQTIAVGTTRTLTAIVATTGGANDAVTWGSSDGGVASIDGDGAVDALSTGTTTITATSAADPSYSDSITLTVEPPGTLAWTRQFGSDRDDFALGIASDADDNLYAVGYTRGDLEGTNVGFYDAFVRSYDSAGTHRWTRQFGPGDYAFAYDVAVDTNGNVYVAGSTFGALEGINAGSDDAFVRAYDSAGNHRWTRQFGTIGGDQARGVATDANGNVYLAGSTGGALEGTNAGNVDAFVRSYDADGNHRWTRQFGTAESDSAYGIAADANGHVYATGNTAGALDGPSAGGNDAYVRGYDSAGNHRWTRQFGTSDNDTSLGIATDADGNVYAAGSTFGALEGTNLGAGDAYIRSYDTDGSHRWTRQFGTGSDDVAYGIATAGNGTVYATGVTSGSLEGTNAGATDAFVRSYTSDGVLGWTRQFGTSSIDGGDGVATDGYGNVYVAGFTYGAILGTSAGETDAFIRKYGP